jgi:hypothetical protein
VSRTDPEPVVVTPPPPEPPSRRLSPELLLALGAIALFGVPVLVRAAASLR